MPEHLLPIHKALVERFGERVRISEDGDRILVDGNPTIPDHGEVHRVALRAFPKTALKDFLLGHNVGSDFVASFWLLPKPKRKKSEKK